MKEYDEELINEIIENVDIVEFIGEYVDLKKENKRYFGLCPFHSEKTPSFCVEPESHLYYCFGCGNGGTVITFCRKYLHMKYDEAIQYLSSLAGIDAQKKEVCSSVKLFKQMKRKKDIVCEKPKPHNIIKPYILTTFEYKEITEWENEGIPQEIMTQYGVAYDRHLNPRYDRIVYPVYDLSGNLINVKGRALCANYKEQRIPKYQNYYAVGDLDYFQGMNYNYNDILEAKEIIIFESFKSVMKAKSFGYNNAVSSETCTLTLFQVRLLIQMHVDVVIAFDNDIPLSKVKNSHEISILSKFTNVYVVVDKNGLLGDKSLKNAPVDCGKEIWEQLYKERLKI